MRAIDGAAVHALSNSAAAPIRLRLMAGRSQRCGSADSVPDVYRILPEVILTITGVLIMLVDRCCRARHDRKPLGWLAVLGVIAALVASVWQFHLPRAPPIYGTVQTDAFSVFFHVLICGIVLVALLDRPRRASTAARNTGRVLRARRLRRRRHVPHDLRRRAAAGLHRPRNLFHLHLHPGRHSASAPARAPKPRSSTSCSAPSPPPSSSTASRSPSAPPAPPTSPPSPQRLPQQPRPRLRLARRGHDPHRPRLQGLRRALPGLDARRLRRRALAGRRASCPPRPRPPPSPFCCASSTAPIPQLHAHWLPAPLDPRRALHDDRQPRRAAPAERQAHAGLLLHRPRRLLCWSPSPRSPATASPPPASTPLPTPP